MVIGEKPSFGHGLNQIGLGAWNSEWWRGLALEDQKTSLYNLGHKETIALKVKIDLKGQNWMNKFMEHHFYYRRKHNTPFS